MHESRGARLKAVRARLDLSQVAMAEKVGVTHRAWANYERDVRSPKLSVYDALIRLGVSEQWLQTGVGEMMIEDRKLLGPGHTDREEEFAQRVVMEVERIASEAAKGPHNVEYMRGVEATLFLVMTRLGAGTDFFVSRALKKTPAGLAQAIERGDFDGSRSNDAPKPSPRRHK